MPLDRMPNLATTEGLKTLLSLSAAEVSSHPKVVFTSAPHLWIDHPLRLPLVVDVSALVGSSSQAWRHYDSQLEEYVVESLIEQGIDHESIRTNYRPNLRSNRTVDIVIIGTDGNPFVALEVKRKGALNTSAREQLFKEMRETIPTAQWYVVTDGDSFRLVGREADEGRILNRAPTAGELGLYATERRVTATFLRPRNLEELATRLSGVGEISAIVDFTLPFGLRTKLSDLEAQLEASMPIPERLRGRLEPIAALMLWLSGQNSVKALTCAIPSSLGNNSLYEPVRSAVSKELGLIGILELPHDLFRPFISIGLTLIYLGPRRDETYLGLVSSSSELKNLDSQMWFHGLRRWLSGAGPSAEYTTNVVTENRWSVAANNPEIDRIYSRLGHLGELVPLSSVCEFLRGVNFRNGEAETSTNSESGVPCVGSREVRSGTINLDDCYKVSVDQVSERSLLANDDILIPSILTDKISALLFQTNQPATFQNSVIALRVRDDAINPKYLVEFLNSTVAHTLIWSRAMSAAGPARIHTSLLREIQIPILPGNLFEGIEESKEMEAELRSKADELETSRRALFDSPTFDVLAENTGNLKRKGKVLATSLRSAERLEFQIANFYPFPVAYSFRLLAGQVRPETLYKEQLRVAENLLAFLASISLALVQKTDLDDAGINLRSYWQGGISPGDWKDIVARCSKIFVGYENVALANSIQKLNIGSENKGFGFIAKALVRSLNDFKHHRGPTIEEDYIAASKEVSRHLTDAMSRIAFFTEFPIRQVRDVNPRRSGTKVDLTCLRYTGDHPGLPQEEVVFDRSLPKEDLFVDLGGKSWVNLYPFMTSHNCPSCKTRETYLIDKWDVDRNVAFVKSFERGHSEQKSDVATSLDELCA